MPLIDFSKIRIKGTPSKAAAPSIPAKGRRIDFSAIKFPPISAPKQTPVRQKPAPVVAKSSTPFIGRPLVTPVEQQRMKAAAPVAPIASRLTGKYDPQKYNPEVTPVAPFLQTEAVKRWSAEAAAARKATPEIGQRLLEGMDSFTKIIQPNITPREPGRNTVVDFVGSIASVAAGVYAAKSLLSAIGAGVLYLKTPRSVVDRETTTLFPRFDSSFQAQKYVLKLQQTDPAAAERFKGDLTTLLAQTMAKDMPSTLSDESLRKSASLMYDFLVSNGEAGSFATVGERVASVATAASNLAAAVGNPQMSLVVAERAASQLAKTGMLQLLSSPTVTNRLGTIPMPAGLVHSTAPAIPMGGKTPLVAPALTAGKGATNEVIVNGKRYRPTGIQSNINGKTVGGWEYEYKGAWHTVKGVPQRVEADQIVAASASAPPLATVPQISVSTAPYVSRDKFQVEHPLLERTQPAVPGVKTTKSMDTIMAEEEAMGARLDKVPRAVDKTISALDIKKANLVDVTAKVDLKSVQVKFPSADKVVLDTKRRTVMFMSGATPLEAIAVDKPQLKDWYGIEGAKLLGEITRPAPVVAQIAPTLSKMETPATKQPWEMTRDEYVQSKLVANKYRSQYESDPTAMGGFVKQQQDAWVAELHKRAEAGRISDVTLDNFGQIYGPQAFSRAFRGVEGRGIEDYLPPDVRNEVITPHLTPPITTPAATSATKEPWEMSLDNYLQANRNFSSKSTLTMAWYNSMEQAYVDGKETAVVPPWALTLKEFAARSDDTIDKYLIAEHHGLVAKALANGYSVPPSVLADYPDLKPSVAQAPAELQPLVAEAKKYPSAEAFVVAIENPTNLTTKGLMVGNKNLPVGGELIDTVLDKNGGRWYRVNTGHPVNNPRIEVIPVEQAKVATGWGSGLADFYDSFVGKPASVTPSLSTTPQKGTATTISNQKTNISTSTPVSPRGGTNTGVGAVKWGKWIDAVGTRRTSGVGTGQVDTIKTPVTYRLGSGTTPVRAYAPTVSAERGISGPFIPETGKRLELKGDSHTYYLTRLTEEEAAAEGLANHSTGLAKYRPFSVIEARSGNLIGQGPTVKDAIGRAQETINRNKAVYDGRVEEQVVAHGEIANPASAPTAPRTSTSAPAAAPSLGNAAPAHGLIDYSRIELKGTASVTAPSTLKTAGNPAYPNGRTNASTNSTGKGFDNYIQNTPGIKDTSLSHFAKFKAIRDGYIRFIANEYNWFFKSPLGGEWMTIAVAADDVMLEEYKNPFYIDEAGEQVFVGGELGPAILARYLKASDVIKKRYLQGPNGVDLVASDGKKIPNPNYGKPDFGVFLQNLQRAGIPVEATKGLGADKTNLAQQHISDARMNLVNFQKNLPQLFTKYMAQAQEIGNANALLAEFYKGIISPETYANDKANPHYYVSLSAGKTDVFDRSGVAPLERAHGLTNLDEVVPPLEGLIDVYVAAIRARGINRAKMATVAWNKNSEVATTDLSDSIVHLWDDGVDRAYEVHDKDAGASIRNLTRSKWEIPSLVKRIFTAPTTLMRISATGANIAFGVFNPVRDIIQAAGLVPFTPTGLVKGTVKAFKSPGLSQWSKDYRDPTRPTGTKVTEAVKKIVEIVSLPSGVGEALGREVIQESIGSLGGTYLDKFYGYHAGTGFFALHGTFFNDFISGLIPFTRATIAVVRAAYRNAFYGLPIGGKGGTFSGKQGAEKILGKNFLATIIFTMIEMAAIKAAGKEKEYKLLRNRASFFYLYQPSGNWVKLPVPIGSAPVKAIVESLYGYKSDPMDVAGQTLNVIPGLEAFMLPPALTLYLQYKFNINFFTGSPINTGYDTPAKNPLEATIMKLGYTEEQAAMALQSFFADIPSQFQYVFDIVATGSSTQAFPLTKRFIVKDPTTSSNAAVDDFYALVDAAKASKNPALESLVNARANAVGDLLHNAKLYPENAKTYIAGATDFIIATFALIAENPSVYGIKKFGPFSWRPSGNYEELAP